VSQRDPKGIARDPKCTLGRRKCVVSGPFGTYSDVKYADLCIRRLVALRPCVTTSEDAKEVSAGGRPR